MSAKWNREHRVVSRGLAQIYPVRGRTITIPLGSRLTVEQAESHGVETIDLPRAFLADLVTLLRVHDMEDCPDEVFALAREVAEMDFSHPVSGDDLLNDVEAAGLVAEAGGISAIEDLLAEGKSSESVAEQLGLPLWIVLDFERYMEI